MRLSELSSADRLQLAGEMAHDKLGAVQAMVDMVWVVHGKDMPDLCNPFTGELIWAESDSMSSALEVATPREIVTEVAKFHYGLSH